MILDCWPRYEQSHQILNSRPSPSLEYCAQHHSSDRSPPTTYQSRIESGPINLWLKNSWNSRSENSLHFKMVLNSNESAKVRHTPVAIGVHDHVYTSFLHWQLIDIVTVHCSYFVLVSDSVRVRAFSVKGDNIRPLLYLISYKRINGGMYCLHLLIQAKAEKEKLYDIISYRDKRYEPDIHNLSTGS